MNPNDSHILCVPSPAQSPRDMTRASSLSRRLEVPRLLWPGAAIGVAALYLIGPCLSPRGLVFAPVLLTGALALAGLPGVAMLWTMAACLGVAVSWSMAALFFCLGLAYTVLSTAAYSCAMAED